MNQQRTITDAGVSGLPISEGRAALLEEIMATTPLETLPSQEDGPTRRQRRWLPVAAAAAAVAAVTAGAIWLGDQQAPEDEEQQRVATGPAVGELAVLEAEGWLLVDGDVDEHGGELDFALGCEPYTEGCANDQEVQVKWTPSEPFDLYAEDTMEIDGPQVGERLAVLDRRALLFTYDRTDHLVVLEVLEDHLVEIRGAGMGKAELLDLLEQLTPVDTDDLDAHLPEEFITDEERDAVAQEILAPLPKPEGIAFSVESDAVTRYSLGADLTGALTCIWVAQFEDGDAAARQEARDALATARDWPILQEMDQDGGGFAGVVWEIADDVVEGKVPREYEQGLGCE